MYFLHLLLKLPSKKSKRELTEFRILLNWGKISESSLNILPFKRGY